MVTTCPEGHSQIQTSPTHTDHTGVVLADQINKKTKNIVVLASQCHPAVLCEHVRSQSPWGRALSVIWQDVCVIGYNTQGKGVRHLYCTPGTGTGQARHLQLLRGTDSSNQPNITEPVLSFHVTKLP